MHIKAQGSHIQQYDDINIYRQCARILIYKALRAYKPGVANFCTYIIYRLKDLNRYFIQSSSLMRSGGQLWDVREIQENDESVYNDIPTALIDLKKRLTEEEYRFITLRYEGHTYLTIKSMMGLSYSEYSKVRESAEEKTKLYMEEE